MKYCSQCGSTVSLRIPQGDNRQRFVCDQCGFVHYINPTIIAGALVTHENKILLCRRAIEPRHGLWTLPAGFMENGETVAEAATRETYEEAKAEVILHGLYTIFNLPHISQVYMFYRGDLVDGRHEAGEESLETKLFEYHEIPWNKLAFATVQRALRLYLEDVKADHFPIRVEDVIAPRPRT